MGSTLWWSQIVAVYIFITQLLLPATHHTTHTQPHNTPQTHNTGLTPAQFQLNSPTQSIQHSPHAWYTRARSRAELDAVGLLLHPTHRLQPPAVAALALPHVGLLAGSVLDFGSRGVHAHKDLRVESYVCGVCRRNRGGSGRCVGEQWWWGVSVR